MTARRWRRPERRPSSMGETMGGRSWFADYEPPEVGRFMHLTDLAIRLAKMQHEAAMAEARARGLDAAAEARRGGRPIASSANPTGG